MSKVLLVIPEYPLGGAERQIFELANSYDNLFQVIDLKSSKKSRTVDNVDIMGFDIDVLHLKTKNKIVRRFKRYWCLLKLFFKFYSMNADTIVFYNPIFLSLAFFLKIFSDFKIVFSIREYKSSLFSVVGVYLFKKMDLVYTNTPRVKMKLSELGVNCELVLNTITSINVDDKLKRNKDEILVISNLEPHKAIHILLYATKNMSLTINIAGKISNSVYFDYCKKIAEESCCRVNFLGAIPQDNLQEYLKNATCLVHPSILEGTSNAILDAISTGTPLLVSDIPENSYLVDDLDVFLFCANDISDLQLKLKFLLNNSEDYIVLSKLEYLKSRLGIKFSAENLNKIVRLLRDDKVENF